MQTYTKINTLYKRDPETKNIILGDYSLPEFYYLKDLIWECTEKIDGTNIKIGFDGNNITFEGKTENANIPKHLLAKLESLFTVEALKEVFPDKFDELGNIIPTNVILYGEGYGKKIQSGGNYIKDDVNFILFDVKIGNWWLQYNDCKTIAEQLRIDVVPLIGHVTLQQAEDYVIKGFKSTIAENKEYQAEGLVCKPLYGLLNRGGGRIIVKIKTVDYRKLKANGLS